jgi:hypothetical protein
MRNLPVRLLIFIAALSCGSQSTHENHRNYTSEIVPESAILNPQGERIAERFNPPLGFERIPADSTSFAFFLRHLPLKQDESPVKFYDGTIKKSSRSHAAVIDIETGNRDLQQCADAIIRLRAEYLFAQKAYDKIHFNFVSDGKARHYIDYGNPIRSHNSLLKYLNYIFAYANTTSLYNELIAVPDIALLQIGDVIIQTGNPYGHAVIVTDLAKDPRTGEIVYLLAQSFMPAQDIHILKNPLNSEISPWYRLSGDEIVTPDWRFKPDDLRRFRSQ